MSLEIRVSLEPSEVAYVKDILRHFVRIKKKGLLALAESDAFSEDVKKGIAQIMKADIEQSEMLLAKFELYNKIN